MPGVAAGNALKRKPTAITGAVFVDRFRGKIRAGRKKAATRAKQGTQAVAVRFDQYKEKLAHTHTFYPASVLHQAASNFWISALLGSPGWGLRALII